jgi:hypothetical protein
MYTPAPSEHELAAAGLTAEDFEGEAVEVWPENHQAYLLFASLQTQWRVSPGGASGLDFMVAYSRMDRMGLTPEEYEVLDQDLQAMELAALAAMHEKGE